MKSSLQKRQFAAPARGFHAAILYTLIAAVIYAGSHAAFAAPGDLDASFGSGGKVFADACGGSPATDAALQPDGKIVVIGCTSGTSFGVARLNPDGAPDNSFGTNGKATVQVGTNTSWATGVALQADGKIVVAGWTQVSSFGNFVIIRLNGDGALDAAFGTGGKVYTSFSNQSDDKAWDVIVQPDGKIVAAGVSTDNGALAVARYNPNGSLDAGFGTGGKAAASFANASGKGNAVALQPDGKILIVGYVVSGTTTDDFAVARFNSNGTLDQNFGTNGRIVTAVGTSYDTAEDVAVQPDGKIVVAGWAYNSNGDFDFAAVRYLPGGALDSGFGTGGKVTLAFGTAGEQARSVLVQPDGKIVLAGYTSGNNPNTAAMALVRLTTGGALDLGFGINGKSAPYLGTGTVGNAALLARNGGILVAGGSYDSFPNAVVARYQNDRGAVARSASSDFDGDGKTDYALFRPSTGVWYQQNTQSGFATAAWGLSSDRLVPADYDNDGRVDLAIYRNDGEWWIRLSGSNAVRVYRFGLANDIPVPADYTGDGQAELAVYRAGVWYTFDLANSQFQTAEFGLEGDVPTPGDFDGDGRTDYAVYRGGVWYLLQSRDGFKAFEFGLSGDTPVVGDYDGDGRSDPAVRRGGDWYLLQSSQGFFQFNWGYAGDKVTLGDYNGDGRSDPAVWRPETGVFYVLRLSDNQVAAYQFGLNGDLPIAAAFVR